MHWKDHYTGNDEYLRYISAFGFSDRIRYYWSHPKSTHAIGRLFNNLTRYGIPLPLLSQYLPDQFAAVQEGLISCTPDHLVFHKLMRILDRYAKSCGDL
jgi:D-tagatose-1,6-bisphosphate aldolase subunit GatZ/KbaZ